MSDESDLDLIRRAAAAAARVLASRGTVAEYDLPAPSEGELQAALDAARQRADNAAANLVRVEAAVRFFRGLAVLGVQADTPALSRHARHAMKEHRVETPAQLAALTEDEFLSVKNCGMLTLAELKAWLARYGLAFRPASQPGA